MSASYAIIATGGKQHKVAVGDRVQVEMVDAVVGDSVTFDQVLAVKKADTLTIGKPLVQGARVVAKVVEQGKAAKVLIFKKKRTKQYRRTKGHRALHTTLRIDAIQTGK